MPPCTHGDGVGGGEKLHSLVMAHGQQPKARHYGKSTAIQTPSSSSAQSATKPPEQHMTHTEPHSSTSEGHTCTYRHRPGAKGAMWRRTAPAFAQMMLPRPLKPQRNVKPKLEPSITRFPVHVPPLPSNTRTEFQQLTAARDFRVSRPEDT